MSNKTPVFNQQAEPWELRAWAIYDRLEEIRRQQGRQAAEAAAEKAYKRIAPAPPPARETTNR